MQEALKINIKQIMQFIADEKTTPSALSPFYAEEPAANKDSKLDAASIPLVRIVCDPSVSVSARIISPDGMVVTRIYTDKRGQMLVRHWLDKDGLHNFRQVQEKDIADEAALRLMLDIPPTRLDVDTEMSEASFCALLGLIDGWRERTLLSLIDRKPGGKFSLTVDDLYAAFRRSISSHDVRWLTSLVKELYSGNLDVSPSVFKEGIQNVISKFAEAGAQGIKLTPLGEDICATLGAPLAALKLTVSGIKNGAIVEENILGLRGMGIYCTVESVGEDHRKIALKNSSAPMIESYIHSKLADKLRFSGGPETKPSAVEETAKAPQPAAPAADENADEKPAKKFCAECGKSINPEAKFCAGCGTKI
jgi:hypothetical protein